VGLSFGEIFVLAVLALVVIGPKDLPQLLRGAGRLIGQAKRALSDVRRETGLDEVLRGDFRDLERLADHIESLEPYRGVDAAAAELKQLAALSAREYPPLGTDAPGLLPDDAAVYLDLPAHSVPAPKTEASASPPPAESVPAAKPEPVAAAAPIDPIERAS
jgi:sec-independent protein translocase protein TatB